MSHVGVPNTFQSWDQVDAGDCHAGEENIDLVESLRQSKSIKTITVRHEQAGGFMAATYGRLTGHPLLRAPLAHTLQSIPCPAMRITCRIISG